MDHFTSLQKGTLILQILGTLSMVTPFGVWSARSAIETILRIKPKFYQTALDLLPFIDLCTLQMETSVFWGTV